MICHNIKNITGTFRIFLRQGFLIAPLLTNGADQNHPPPLPRTWEDAQIEILYIKTRIKILLKFFYIAIEYIQFNKGVEFYIRIYLNGIKRRT